MHKTLKLLIVGINYNCEVFISHIINVIQFIVALLRLVFEWIETLKTGLRFWSIVNCSQLVASP
jgi:hypothetical protein